ncbi:MAG: selenocysteine-specific translation elongation factor [Phycisphaerae bacterium]
MIARPQLVVGTAGHIDHGKSRLVWTLTGTDPDRLPAEKARGMTIDLGFAHARVNDCDIWFVDVPGHERFIRNMVAGASGVDVAMLVVAADDSVMPQTREHVELLALLGVRRVVLVLTKTDLVDDEWAEQVEQEARELATRAELTPLASVRTSCETGRGLDELRALLARLARDPADPNHHEASSSQASWFRMPIDRAFSVAGRGVVATGSVLHGQVARDAELELWPAGRRVRVRDLQSHHEAIGDAGGRMRLAVNLAGVSLEDVGRGCELATPGFLAATRIFDVRLASLRMPGRLPRRKIRARIHLATSEVLAEVTLAAPPTESRVTGAFAQIRVATPIVAAWGQRFVLRDEGGLKTLGGGFVIRPSSRPWTARRPPDPESLARSAETVARERVAELFLAAPWQEHDMPALAAAAGLADAVAAHEACADLLRSGVLRSLESGGASLLLHRRTVEQLASGVVSRLERHLKANPLAPGIAESEWPAWMPRLCLPRLRPRLAEWMLASGRLVADNGYVLPRGSKLALSKDDQALSQAIVAEIHAGGFSPPTVAALRSANGRAPKRVAQLIDLAAARGKLVRLDDGLWMHAESWQKLIECVRSALRARGKLTVAEIRDVLNSSRKYVVPIVEKLDALGVTKRVGDERVLANGA